MKDPKDTKTISLIPEPKKRGRPVTGSAMTSSERKAAQRSRDRELINWGERGSIKLITTNGLLEEIALAVRRGSPESVRQIANELVKRAKAIDPYH